MDGLPKAIFISGTDTSVGKTVVTALLSLCLKNSGLKVGVLKPFQTGTDSEPVLDIEFIYKTLDENYDIDEVCPCRLKKPLSPDAAAELENYNIPLAKILDHCKNFISRHEITLIEGAGGLYVPVKGRYLMADFAIDLDLPLLLVTRPGLGTINHTLLSAEYIRQKHIEFMGIVINGFKEPPELSYKSNLDTFTSLFNLDILGILPFFDNFSPKYPVSEGVKNNCGKYFSDIFGGSFNYEKFVKKL